MRVLVTGGCGVIGSRIVHHLLADGHQVTVIDACEAPRNKWIRAQLDSNVFVFESRLENPNLDLAETIKDHDAVIHAAASTGIPHSVIHPDDDWKSNVDATRELLEALRVHPRPTVVLSSVKPYRVESVLPIHGLDEKVPLEPDEPYAASKAAQSMLAMAYAKSYDLPVVTFRCSNLYGPAPCHGPRHGWLTWFAISAAIGRPLEVQGTGEQSRDMLHAHDVYTACMAALSNVDVLTGKVFNLGGGGHNRITVMRAALVFQQVTGVEILIRPARRMDDLHVWTDSLAFRGATDWRPRVGVDAGARAVLAWAQDHRADLLALYEGA